ncbi:MAG: ACP S-malonyltransferase [Solirubrobacteraceae bacterium]|nr:ACP S-malonyltransferase [Solirubrobacteraceae bacterium]
MAASVTHVLLFPGQGSEISDMGARVDEYVPELGALAREIVAPDLFERAKESLGLFQPALFCATMAGWERIKRMHDAGKLDLGEESERAFCGHSLGEFGAMAASGALSVEDALQVVKVRGEALEEVRHGDAKGAMMAMIGPGVQDFVAGAADRGVLMANDNSPVQVVVAGTVEAMDWCYTAGKEAGFRVVRLPMNGGAGHTVQAAGASQPIREAFAKVTLHEPTAQIWSAADAAPFTDPIEQLATAVQRNVRWRELVLNLHAAGATRFVESGPGHVLAGLVRKTLGTDGIEAHAIHDLEAEAPAA